jgi:hypothetical protein
MMSEDERRHAREQAEKGQAELDAVLGPRVKR